MLRLAEGFAARGHAVHVVSMLPPPEGRLPLHSSVEFSDLGMRAGAPDPRGLWHLVGVLRRWRPDVVNSHMVHANLLARLARPLARVPVLVSTSHNIHEGASWRQRAYRWTDRWSDGTTSICQAAADRSVGAGAVPASKIRVVHNGLELDDFAPDPESRSRLRAELRIGDGFAWLTVGRLEPQKDVPNLLAAFAALPTAPRRPSLWIVGDGPLRAGLEARAREMGVADRTHFLGIRRDVPALMGAADGFVLGSAWEGLPLVLLEAQAMSLPCVCTDVGGVSEALDAPRSAALVPPGEPTALATAMADWLVLPPASLAEMGRLARQHVEATFPLAKIIDDYLATYRALGAVPAR